MKEILKKNKTNFIFIIIFSLILIFIYIYNDNIYNNIKIENKYETIFLEEKNVGKIISNNLEIINIFNDKIHSLLTVLLVGILLFPFTLLINKENALKDLNPNEYFFKRFYEEELNKEYFKMFLRMNILLFLIILNNLFVNIFNYRESLIFSNFILTIFIIIYIFYFLLKTYNINNKNKNKDINYFLNKTYYKKNNKVIIDLYKKNMNNLNKKFNSFSIFNKKFKEQEIQYHLDFLINKFINDYTSKNLNNINNNDKKYVLKYRNELYYIKEDKYIDVNFDFNELNKFQDYLYIIFSHIINFEKYKDNKNNTLNIINFLIVINDSIISKNDFWEIYESLNKENFLKDNDDLIKILEEIKFIKDNKEDLNNFLNNIYNLIDKDLNYWLEEFKYVFIKNNFKLNFYNEKFIYHKLMKNLLDIKNSKSILMENIILNKNYLQIQSDLDYYNKLKKMNFLNQQDYIKYQNIMEKCLLNENTINIDNKTKNLILKNYIDFIYEITDNLTINNNYNIFLYSYHPDENFHKEKGKIPNTNMFNKNIKEIFFKNIDNKAQIKRIIDIIIYMMKVDSLFINNYKDKYIEEYLLNNRLFDVFNNSDNNRDIKNYTEFIFELYNQKIFNLEEIISDNDSIVKDILSIYTYKHKEYYVFLKYLLDKFSKINTNDYIFVIESLKLNFVKKINKFDNKNNDDYENNFAFSLKENQLNNKNKCNEDIIYYDIFSIKYSNILKEKLKSKIQLIQNHYKDEETKTDIEKKEELKHKNIKYINNVIEKINITINNNKQINIFNYHKFIDNSFDYRDYNKIIEFVFKERLFLFNNFIDILKRNIYNNMEFNKIKNTCNSNVSCIENLFYLYHDYTLLYYVKNNYNKQYDLESYIETNYNFKYLDNYFDCYYDEYFLFANDDNLSNGFIEKQYYLFKEIFNYYIKLHEIKNQFILNYFNNPISKQSYNYLNERDNYKEINGFKNYFDEKNN